MLQAAGDSELQFGQELQNYAAAVSAAINQAKKEFWEEVSGAAFTGLSLGAGAPLAAAIAAVAEIIAQLGLSAETVPFALSTFVVSPPGAGLRAGTSLGSRAPGAKVAGAPRKLSTGMLWPGILGSLGVGGLAGLAARDGSLVKWPGRGGAPRSQPGAC
jgi:hypothetical protein